MILKYVVPIAAVAMLGFAVYHVARTYPVQPAARPPMPPSQPSFDHSLAATGIVEPPGGSVAVAAPVPGVVAEVFVRVGQKALAGAPLFRLDDRSLKAELRVREAQLTTAREKLARLEEKPRQDELAASAARVGEAQASVKAHRAELGRAQQLLEKQLMSPLEVERLEHIVAAAQEQLARAQAEDRHLRTGASEADRAIARAGVAEAGAFVDQAKTELGRLTVRAPLSATVLKVNVQNGEAVGTKPPIILGDIHTLHLRLDIEEHQIPRFDPDAPARAMPRGQPAPSFPLRFVRIEPLVVPKSALVGDSGERQDTRVLQAIYEFDAGKAPIYVGQQMDVFIALKPPVTHTQSDGPTRGAAKD
jgi:multidrug resistance efflux pump